MKLKNIRNRFSVIEELKRRRIINFRLENDEMGRVTKSDMNVQSIYCYIQL